MSSPSSWSSSIETDTEKPNTILVRLRHHQKLRADDPINKPVPTIRIGITAPGPIEVTDAHNHWDEVAKLLTAADVDAEEAIQWLTQFGSLPISISTTLTSEQYNRLPFGFGGPK